MNGLFSFTVRSVPSSKLCTRHRRFWHVENFQNTRQVVARVAVRHGEMAQPDGEISEGQTMVKYVC